jgi:hypothetical protein
VLFIPDPDPDFLPMPDPGVKKAPDPGSGFATLFSNSKQIHSNSTGSHLTKKTAFQNRDNGGISNGVYTVKSGHKPIIFLWIPAFISLIAIH